MDLINKEFKYKEHHEKLDCDCPDTASLSPVNKVVYRFVFPDVNNFNNHHPPLLINPTRVDLTTCKAKCNGYALSFFSDFKKAEKKLTDHLSRKPNLAEVLGNCIGKLNITLNDGEGDKEDAVSHFNFHEYNRSDYYQIEILKTIDIE